jgi:drug/metabolite transporter (DMT)-like permease
MAAVLILIAACFYGVSPILAKAAYGYGVTPLVLLTWRVTIGGTMFWTAALATRQLTPITPRLAGTLLLLGTTLAPFQVAAYFYALSLLPASTASVIVNTSPVHVAWMERLILGEHLVPADLVILAVIVAGAVLVAGATPQAEHSAGIPVLGAATLASALYLVIQRRLVRDVHPLVVLVFIQTGSAAVYWTAAAATGQIGTMPSAPAAIAIAGSAVLSSVASLLALIALRSLTATRTAMLGMLEPVVTVVLSVALLADHMTPARLAGVVTVLGGIAVFYRRLRQGLGSRRPIPAALGKAPPAG